MSRSSSRCRPSIASTPTAAIHRIITDAGKPNGVCVSPDQKTLYVVSNDNGTTAASAGCPRTRRSHKGRMALLAYDLAADGTAKFRKTLVDYAPQDGPDGLAARRGRQPVRRRAR